MDYKMILEKAPARKTYGQYVKLFADGSFWRGPCPLCETEKNSFQVIAENKEYYCWECRSYGSMVMFVSNVESVTLKEAAQMLINLWGIRMEDGDE